MMQTWDYLKNLIVKEFNHVYTEVNVKYLMFVMNVVINFNVSIILLAMLIYFHMSAELNESNA